MSDLLALAFHGYLKGVGNLDLFPVLSLTPSSSMSPGAWLIY
jgi:hypothetical protein